MHTKLTKKKLKKKGNEAKEKAVLDPTTIPRIRTGIE